MPSLGADMDAGTIIEWLVKPGATVEKGDIVAVVDTAKSAVEVETFVGGVVDEILVEPGQEVAVGTPLAKITSPGEAAAPSSREERPAPPPPVAVRKVTSPLVRRLATDLGVDLGRVEGTGRRGTITQADVRRAATAAPVEQASAHPPAPARPRGRRASPYSRRLAAELGVDLDQLTGTGPRGELRAQDVRSASAAARPTTPTPPSAEVETAPVATAAGPSPAMRTAIARLMTRSKQQIPHYYLSSTVDLAAAMRWLGERNRALPISERLVPAAILLKATAVAARRRPEFNGFWMDDHFVPGTSVHLGVGISLRGGGLVAPALRDAADLTVSDLMARLRDLVTRARAGRLRRTELADPTITVTNMGDQGVESVFGVIYPPQVALVGFGRIVDRPWAVDGLLGVRPVVTVTVSADHRATDGFAGARFLATIDELLQHPEAL